MQRALLDVWPALEASLAWTPLGDLPTPVQEYSDLGSLWVKRDDLSSPVYGGNKVRTLELLFGEAQAGGAERVYATGAYGSNHATATVLHAPRVGLESGVVLFPQPRSLTAVQNLKVSLARADDRVLVPHWAFLPAGMLVAGARSRRAGRPAYVMPPGGATPLGALGYVSAALELAEQVRARELPLPRAIVVGVGSTCTSAGLLVGLHCAARLGFGFAVPPELISVRVSPWPVTSRFRVLGLAVRTARLLSELLDKPEFAFDEARLGAKYRVEGGFLGAGYGLPSPAGLAAIERFAAAGLPGLDTTYSAKSGAGALALLAAGKAPLLYWATKSSAPLPEVASSELSEIGTRVQRFLRLGLVRAHVAE